MQKYIGKTIEIIYLGSDGRITQRQIEVNSVSNGIIRARCLQRNAPRIFKLENILAAQPTAGRAS
ncbi:hypothetical protein ACHHV8_25335 [Paenibacillus sp. TAB 01]|uniref:hypothetical protein n=1 Tax=Paenibacillus sp. TAB 01 TaxID=3368988 RepID=UPI0037502172